MGVISRFADIMAANVNALLDKCEDPAKMVDQTLRKLNENLADVKKETAGVIAEEKACKRRLDDAAAEVEKWDKRARSALTANNEGDARKFLAEKQKAEQNRVEAEKVWQVASDNADKMRQMHDKLVNDIASLNARKDTIKAKASVAKAQQAVNKATAGANSATTMAGFDRMEERVNKQLDAAMAEADLNKKPVSEAEELAEKYETGADSASVDEALAAMKAEMGL